MKLLCKSVNVFLCILYTTVWTEKLLSFFLYFFFYFRLHDKWHPKRTVVSTSRWPWCAKKGPPDLRRQQTIALPAADRVPTSKSFAKFSGRTHGRTRYHRQRSPHLLKTRAIQITLMAAKRVEPASTPGFWCLDEKKTTSTIRSADIKPQSPNFQGITTACFKEKNVRGTGMEYVKDPLASDVKQVGSKTYRRAYGGNVNLNARVSLSSTRAVNLTFRQSADPTIPTFASHFRQTGNAHRLIRFSNLKYTMPNAIYGKILGQGGTAKTHTNKSVTFRKSKTRGPSLGRGSAETKDWTVGRTISVQAPKSGNFSSKSPQNSQAHENAVRRYRDIRNIKDNEQLDFAIARKRQATCQTKRKMLRRPTVTVTLKQSKDTGITTSKGDASAVRKSVTMARRCSTRGQHGKSPNSVGASEVDGK